MNCPVAPCTGAWIETSLKCLMSAQFMSPLAQGRGLKLGKQLDVLRAWEVAPCTGAWIETAIQIQEDAWAHVAPCTGAWIETNGMSNVNHDTGSRPLHRGVD